MLTEDMLPKLLMKEKPSTQKHQNTSQLHLTPQPQPHLTSQIHLTNQPQLLPTNPPHNLLISQLQHHPTNQPHNHPTSLLHNHPTSQQPIKLNAFKKCN